PVESNVAFAPSPLTWPAAALYVYVSASPSGSLAVEAIPVRSPGMIGLRSVVHEITGFWFGFGSTFKSAEQLAVPPFPSSTFAVRSVRHCRLQNSSMDNQSAQTATPDSSSAQRPRPRLSPSQIRFSNPLRSTRHRHAPHQRGTR